MSLKIKIALGILVISGLLVYIFLVSKWNREMVAPASVHSNTVAYESAKKEIELSLLENRDSILSITKYPVLIYRYSHDNCGSCITEDLSELNILQDEVAKGYIIVLPAYEENQQNRVKLANQLASFEYKNMLTSLLVIPKNEEGFTQRYFALIDNKGNLGEVHFTKRKHCCNKSLFSTCKRLL